MSRFLSVLFTLLTLTALSGCASVMNRCEQILPVHVLQEEPAFTSELTLQSPDGAVRYMAMRSMLEGEVSPNTHDVEHDRWDRFIAIRFADDVEDTETYFEYLKARQELFDQFRHASLLASFGDFGEEPAYFESRLPQDDPRRVLLGTMRLITLALADDAQRLWIQGDHATAIERIRTIFHIAMQMKLDESYESLDGMVAVAIANVGLKRIRRMSQTEQATPEQIRSMLGAVELLSGEDPLGVYCERRRTMCSYQAWLADQLESPDGTLELWALIARFHEANELVGQLFRNAINNTDMGLPEPDLGLTNEQILEQLINELDEISVSMIRAQYLRCEPLVNTAMRELESGSPDIEVIAALGLQLEDDPTGVSDILGLSTLESFLRAYQMFLEERDSVHNLLQPSDQ